MIGDGKLEGYFWIGCLLEKGRNVGSFLAHYLLRLFRGAFDRRENNAIVGNDLLPLLGTEEFYPLPSFFLMFATHPNRVRQSVKHRLASIRPDWQRRKALLEFGVIQVPVDHPGAGQRHGALARSEETIGAELAGVTSRNYKALVHLVHYPLEGFRELGVVVVEFLRPWSVVELKAVRDREVTPLHLAKSIGRAVYQQAVLLDLLGIEIRRQSVVTRLINRE